ncbi:MAG TPA: Flp family type IVb pilin [Alphaproteobacteria bacterium]|nr:Flp family type IVb pilin [Alphaproteobacteria bacterium]
MTKSGFRTLISRFGRDRKGATAIEYGLIAGFIAVALLAALPGLTSALTGMFEGISSSLTANTPSGS